MLPRIMNIRPATMADLDTIAAFNLQLAKETEELQLDSARVTQGVRALLGDPAKGLYYVAELDAVIAGQLMITYEWSDWRNGCFWWLQSVYVSPAFRSRGVFKALFERIKSLARERADVCGLRLYMDQHNDRARLAYESLGMSPAHYQLFEIDFVLNGSGKMT